MEYKRNEYENSSQLTLNVQIPFIFDDGIFDGEIFRSTRYRSSVVVDFGQIFQYTDHLIVAVWKLRIERISND